ncbi:hypothetical protein LOK49_LG06G01137 [Camellia lanceoleosa]|uniref:Uncharacterized protein n=1 Tax=Camellia lanceoleosa TaxID=1840588 RepID=A0ACC0HG09_9ERIC|nr:hypothetical protein LOK49_LG06G01137 [Camellia lanceoleosa]
MKKTIFEEQTAKALKKWQKAAKDRKKLRKKGRTPDNSVSGLTSGENTPSQGLSPIYLLHKHKVSSSAGPELESIPNSPRSYQFDLDTELSETEIFAHGRHDSTTRPHVKSQRNDHESHSIDFSFVKP